jgi:excisionase family DNA binding protein
MTALEKEFYNTKELAALLQVAEMTIYRLVKRGELPSYMIGSAMRFRRDDIEEYLQKCRTAGDQQRED